MMPIRPVDPNDVKKEITMVAKNQPEFQTLPSIFMKDNCVCVSRWAFEELPDYNERELLKEYKTLWLYQTSMKPVDELTGHFLSSEFISEESLSDEMRYSNRVFYNSSDDTGYRILFPESSELQEHVYRYKWELSENQVNQALESNSIFIYQFNLRNQITPLYISLYHGILLQ